MHNEKLKEIAKRLRVRDRLSLGAIARTLNISKSTASLWLKGCRLTQQEERALNTQKRRRQPLPPAMPDPNWREELLKRNVTKKQATQISEAAVLYRLCLCGVDPYRSPFEGDTSDWLALVEDKYLRIQVKSVAHGKHGRPTVKLWRTVGHGQQARYSGEVDFVVGYDRRIDVAYVYDLRRELKENKSTVSVSEGAAEAWGKLWA
jgi:hypothetical protein